MPLISVCASSDARSHHPTWAEEVQAVVAGLANLNRTTESDFLAIGGNLLGFLSASRQLHDQIAGLSALVSGEQAQRACDALLSVRRYAEEMQDRSRRRVQALLILRTSADRIRQRFSRFGKIVLSFRLTAILARVEAAHLAATQQNLKNLADDVRSCSDAIRKRADEILEVAAGFDSRIAATLGDVSRFDAIQARELPALLAAVGTDMDVFQIRQRETATVSSDLAAELQAITRELGAVATSIQFHDITRQQVDHVIDALQGMPQDPSNCPISSSGAALVRLQKAQLRQAEAAFAHATLQIDRELERINARVGEMAAAANRIQRLDCQETERRFGAIAQVVAELDSMESGARASVAGLDGIGRDLGIAVNEIQNIESDLHYIALNAIISSGHIGPRGEALRSIANTIRQLRLESASHSEDAQAALDSIGEAIRSLADTGVAAHDNGALLLENLNTSVADLQSVSVNAAGAAANIAILAQDLCARLRKSREEFGIGSLFAGTVNHCCDLLDGIASQGPASKFSRPQLTGDTHYTMHAERVVHQAVAGGMTPMAFEAGSMSTGTNVEFF